MCWPFSSPGGFSLLGKNALIEIFFCIPKHWKEATTGIQDKWINFIDFDHHQGWRKIPFYLHLSRSYQRFFSTFRKKLRWEAYSNFHQRLLQITRGRVNYGRSIIWRQKAWLWSTSLKVKYDWENCFCPKKPKVKKAEKRRWCWDAPFLTDFSCRLQAEHDGYLPWNNWIKLLYQKWLWF